MTNTTFLHNFHPQSCDFLLKQLQIITLTFFFQVLIYIFCLAYLFHFGRVEHCPCIGEEGDWFLPLFYSVHVLLHCGFSSRFMMIEAIFQHCLSEKVAAMILFMLSVYISFFQDMLVIILSHKGPECPLPQFYFSFS